MKGKVFYNFIESKLTHLNRTLGLFNKFKGTNTPKASISNTEIDIDIPQRPSFILALYMFLQTS